MKNYFIEIKVKSYEAGTCEGGIEEVDHIRLHLNDKLPPALLVEFITSLVSQKNALLYIEHAPKEV